MKYQKSISSIMCFSIFTRMKPQLLWLKTFAIFIQAHWIFENAKYGFPNSYNAILISLGSDNDVLRAKVWANLCRTMKELLNTLNQPYSTIQERRFKKYAVLAFGSPIICPDRILRTSISSIDSTPQYRSFIWSLYVDIISQTKHP